MQALPSSPNWVEECSCGAALSVNFGATRAWSTLEAIAKEWRSNHRHDMGGSFVSADARSLGFNLEQTEEDYDDRRR